MKRPSAAAAAAVVAVALATIFIPACSGDDDDASSSPCDREPVDQWKELLVVEDSVVSSARARNDTAGPWSFRHVMEQAAPEGVSPSAFTFAWLDKEWRVEQINGAKVYRPDEDRPRELRRRILCPWLRRSPQNACNDDCSACTSTTQALDLAQAPFRLIAIANRIDLRDEVASAPRGESRFVFGLTDGPADDPASTVMPMSIIAEYVLPESKSLKDWANAWHALGRHAALDESYLAELETLTRSFSSRGVNPAGVSGSALGQIRTNESVLSWRWELREFALGDDGYLKLFPLRNTPISSLNNTPALRDHIVANRDAILSKKYEMPDAIRGGAAEAPTFVWNAPNLDEPLRKAFAGGTCNGCHTTENRNVDTAFHISPFRSGIGKVSPFLYDPRGGGNDELTARAKSMRRALCSP